MLSRAGVEQLILDRRPGNQLTYTLDVGATLLPTFDTPAYDSTSRVLHITTVGGATPTLLRTNVAYRHPGPGASATWYVFSSMTDTLQLPALPDGIGPSVDDSVGFTFSAWKWSDVADYAAARVHFDDSLGGPAFRFSSPLTVERL